MSSHRGWLRRYGVWLLSPAAILIAFFPARAMAVGSGFNIQVSPSPLVVTLTPGQRRIATLTVRNLTSHSETLKPRLNGFVTDARTGKIELKPQVALDLDKWVSFKQDTLTIAPGGSQPLEIVYNPPADVGFSYSAAIVLSSNTAPAPTQGGATIQASIAVFNLVNIDRMDAKRQLTIESFAADKSRYEYLPARFTLTVKNNGNVIGQPTGNIFIQRSFNDSQPLATIPLNASGSYILPGVSRALTSSWESGFPRYEITQAGEGTTNLKWNWRNLNQLRIGKYVAKAVLVYNDGQRDVPVVASYTFWVMPWKLLCGVVLLGVLVTTGLVAWGRLLIKGTKKVKKYASRRK